MYYELREGEYDVMHEITKITFADYEMKGNLIPVDALVVALEDLLSEYRRKEEEIEDLKNEIEENYELKRTNPYEEYGVSERDFIEEL